MAEAQDLKVLSISEAARLIGKPESWLRQKISRGEGPPARRASPHRTCILHCELWQWLDGLECLAVKQKRSAIRVGKQFQEARAPAKE
jgi:hypothetical protein